MSCANSGPPLGRGCGPRDSQNRISFFLCNLLTPKGCAKIRRKCVRRKKKSPKNAGGGIFAIFVPKLHRLPRSRRRETVCLNRDRREASQKIFSDENRISVRSRFAALHRRRLLQGRRGRRSRRDRLAQHVELRKRRHPARQHESPHRQLRQLLVRELQDRRNGSRERTLGHRPPHIHQSRVERGCEGGLRICRLPR